MHAVSRTLPGFRSSAALLSFAICATIAGAVPASAQRAGATIVNVATAEIEIGGATARIASNPASLRIAERLDISLSATTAVIPTAVQPAAAFVLTNAGNGSE